MTLKPLKPLHVFLFLLLALLIATLVYPSTREAHSLCLRLLFHLKGNTLVQGQVNEFDNFIIPNAQFTKEYQKQLRTNSNASLDDYLLATATGDYFEWEMPQPRESWTNHTALQWSAFRFAQIAIREKSSLINSMSADSTNALNIISCAQKTVRLAQSTAPTNGALWLAEAAIEFGDHDEAALAALRIAAQKTPWSADSESSFLYIVKLLETAGMPHLDSAIYANYYYRSDLQTLSVQGEIRQNLNRLMTNAIFEKDDQRSPIS